MIGPMVEKRRKDIYLVTKSGGRTYDAFMWDVETSLGKLKTDHLDLLHIWNLPRNADLDEIENGALKAVRTLQEQKVIQHFGVTGHSGAAILMEAIRRFDPDAVLTVFPCTRDDKGRYEDQLLPLARERKMGVIAMKTVRKARNADLKGTDLIRYALSLEGIHSAIVGLDTLAHLNDNAEMASNFKPLTPEERLGIHTEATRALAGIPTPWEQPGYQDGTPV
jgi:aryl-alcohol dehydrogenase-like predicted oxidoreductase